MLREQSRVAEEERKKEVEREKVEMKEILHSIQAQEHNSRKAKEKASLLVHVLGV